MLIDTSGWFCLFDKNDVRNERARSYYDEASSRSTHSYVIAEFIALAEARKKARSGMLAFVRDLIADSELDIIWVDEIITLRALDLLSERRDKKWSLCDAVSFILMSDGQIQEALTTDHHFEQAGFVRLLDA